MAFQEKRRLVMVTIGAGVLLVLLDIQRALVGLGILLIAAGCILDFVLIRCPGCKRWIGKCPGEFCRHCRAKIDWAARKNKG